MKELFAIDFDGTITATPDIWKAVVEMLRAKGSDAWVVTQRRDTEENREEIRQFLKSQDFPFMAILFTNLAPKTWAAEKRGLRFTQWVDDSPEKAVNGY